jgi:hypothetical protein
MGLELHISRAEHWAENLGQEISAPEWLAYVASDPELQLQSENGPYNVRWLGISKHDEPWLDWVQGNVSTKWPDTALFYKILAIAAAFGASVQDDDGTKYTADNPWQYDPSQRSTDYQTPHRLPWWKRLFAR